MCSHDTQRTQNGTNTFTVEGDVTVSSANTPDEVHFNQEPKLNLLTADFCLLKPKSKNSHVEKLIKRRGWR